jgi:hypothetical protein
MAIQPVPGDKTNSLAYRFVVMRGDRVEVLVDIGGGVERFEITATRAGRRVDISNVRGTVEVSEVTRSGRPVRSARFMASRVVAIVEHPADEPSR